MKLIHYDVKETAYWRKFRQGRRERGRFGRPAGMGHYSRRKRNNDIRAGARMNERFRMTDDLQLGANRKYRRRFRGAIRRQRLALEHCDAQQAQLRKEVRL